MYKKIKRKIIFIVEYLLKKRCPTAEKLHSSLSGVLKKYEIVRVRTRFLSYDLLYLIKPGKWFAFSFNKDFRDDYIDLKVGGLYHFGDFMPRFVVVGEYAENIRRLNSEGIINSKIPILENANKNIKENLEIIKNTFEAVIANIDIEIEYEKKEKERLSSYLIKEIQTFDELKEVDKNAVAEDI
jgi:hypothetical protein